MENNLMEMSKEDAQFIIDAASKEHMAQMPKVIHCWACKTVRPFYKEYYLYRDLFYRLEYLLTPYVHIQTVLDNDPIGFPQTRERTYFNKLEEGRKIIEEFKKKLETLHDADNSSCEE